MARQHDWRFTPAFAAAGAAAAATLAFAQPSNAPPQARPSPLTTPGVGGCIYDRISDPIRKLGIYQVAVGQGLPRGLITEIERVANQCVGRPVKKGDPVVQAAALSIVMRNGAAVRVKSATGLMQTALDDAWRAAPPDDQEPYLAGAREALEGRPHPTDVAAVEPFKARLKTATPLSAEAISAVSAYFYATALGELAEARLAGQRPRSGG